MALTGQYTTQSIENVQITDSGNQRVVLSVPVSGTVGALNTQEPTVLVDDGNGNKQLAMAVVNFGTVSASSLESVNGETGAVVLNGTNIEATVGGATDTVENHLNTIKTDLGDLGDDLTDLGNDVVKKSETSLQAINSPVSVKTEFDVVGGTGENFKVSFANGITTIATNDGLDVLPKTNFAQTPTVEGNKTFDNLAMDELTNKVQVLQAILVVVGNHFDKWVLSGTPENLTLTESLQPVYMPATTRFPSLPPASMEVNADGTGIIFKTAGLIHFKRSVSLAGSNTGNIYYQARINGQEITQLNAQAVSISENTMSYTVEFYWQVSANQEMTIWANSVDGNVPLNYRGVTTIVEYL